MGKHKTETATLLPAVASKQLRQGRAVTGEKVGFVVDTVSTTVTFSFQLGAAIDVDAAHLLLADIGRVDSVYFCQITISPLFGDRCAITMWDPAQTKKTDISDVMATAELAIPTIVDVMADHGIESAVCDSQAVIAYAQQVVPGWGDSFPPRSFMAGRYRPCNDRPCEDRGVFHHG
ncbi:MAG: hypothetical protein SOW59_08490 [Corynebacterium sp.]|nr:hypothetical protein [Corynebacterium sp.]